MHFFGKSAAEAREEILNLVEEYCKSYRLADARQEGDAIPYAARAYDSAEMINLVDSALDFGLTGGCYTEKFEKAFAAYVGVSYCSLVNSYSSANLVAFMALTSPLLGERRILPGDEVITVAVGLPTAVAPIVQYGAVPVFVDVTLPQCNIDVAGLEAALSVKTKAVMVAHMAGNPYDLKTVRNFCNEYDLWLIEDNGNALGAEYDFDGTVYKTGAVGDISTASFSSPSHLTMGEGGAVLTRDTMLHRIICSMCEGGRDFAGTPAQPDTYVYSHFGYHVKATDLQAAVGLAQLEKLPALVARRRAILSRLHASLQEVADKLLLPESCAGGTPSPLGLWLTCREGVSRDRVVAYLKAHGVKVCVPFAGNLLRQPCFEELCRRGGCRTVGTLPVTDRVMRDAFLVNVDPSMTDEAVACLAGAIKEALA